MVDIQRVETAETLPHLYALTLADDGSPAQDKTVSVLMLQLYANLFLGARTTKTRVIYYILILYFSIFVFLLLEAKLFFASF